LSENSKIGHFAACKLLIFNNVKIAVIHHSDFFDNLSSFLELGNDDSDQKLLTSVVSEG
jgi:hypothetical protein